MSNEPTGKATDSSERAERDTYDRGIIPAETAARKEREGDEYKTAHTESATDGYTVDNEGLINNYAVEPEMYYEVPGDAREAEEAEKARRMEELKEIKEDNQGELTADSDERGKGVGAI
ncbi:hypothetical protein [Calothrix sp. PCC 6303]|uniref:hypothetical protein n=1 Tax=Calothrix sp. PCC 6303 TaxID=1170562 RepID=UPI0002A0362F|nr:hypothetical protein [Calothrix sp. PCC 6303]AFZ02151.1 hypothetical protein Cal6303_3210 [Calothrix sp. PCC 6303]